MTIAENLKQSIKDIVDESMDDQLIEDVLERSKWFSDLVESIVDERLNEIQGSAKDSDDFQKTSSTYFLIRWGEGYAPSIPEVLQLDKIIKSEDWDLPREFIDSLKEAIPNDTFIFTDFTGEIHFQCVSDDFHYRRITYPKTTKFNVSNESS